MDLCLLFLIYFNLFLRLSQVNQQIEYELKKFYQQQQREDGKQLSVFYKRIFQISQNISFQEHVEHHSFLFQLVILNVIMFQLFYLFLYLLHSLDFKHLVVLFHIQILPVIMQVSFKINSNYQKINHHRYINGNNEYGSFNTGCCWTDVCWLDNK